MMRFDQHHIYWHESLYSTRTTLNETTDML